MSIQLKEPLRSIKRIGVKPWFIRFQHNLFNHSIHQSNLLRHVTLHRQQKLFHCHRSNHSLPLTIDVSPTQTVKHALKKESLWEDHLQRPKSDLNVTYYEQLMSKLADQPHQSKRWERVIELFEESKSAGMVPSPAMYLSTMSAYGALGESSQVTRTFKNYKKHYRLSSGAYHQYMKAILECNDLITAQKIFYSVHSHPKQLKKEASQCLAELVTAYAASNKRSHFNSALKAIEDLYQSSAPETWDAKAQKQITLGIWTHCHKLAKCAADTPITPTSVEHIIALYIEKPTMKNRISPGQLSILLHLIRHQTTLTARTCNLVLECLATRHDYSGIKSVIRLMQTSQIEPDLDTASILLQTFGSALPTDQARQLYENSPKTDRLRQAFLKIFASDPSQVEKIMGDGQPCLDTYAVLLEGTLQQGRWTECIQAFQQLQQDFPDILKHHRLVKTMVTAQLAQNQMAACDDFLAHQVQFDFSPNTIMRIVQSLLRLERDGRPLVPGRTVVKSIRLLESRLHLQLDAEAIGRIISQLGDRGECEEGYELYRWVRQHAPGRERCSQSRIYRAMIMCATKNNDMRLLERAWIDMQFRKRFLNDDCSGKEEHTLSGYNMLLNGYASRQPQPHLTRLKKVFKQMLERPLEPDLVTYNILIKAFVQANDMAAAQHIYKKMMADSNIQPDPRTINTLLHGWIVRKDWKQVENFVEDLTSEPDRMSRNLDIVTFNLLVQSFLKLETKSYKDLNKLKWHDRTHPGPRSMSSESIWHIFESTTGYKRLTENIPSSPPTSLDALCSQLIELKTPVQHPTSFVQLFSKTTRADQVTCKLFMKAFVHIGDYHSASKIYHWMTHVLPHL